MKILVTGTQGQDGYLISKLLFEMGHEVVGIGRRKLDLLSPKDSHLLSLDKRETTTGKFTYEICDLRSSSSVALLIANHSPEVIINLAALSNPAESWSNCVETIVNDTLVVVNILDSIRLISKNTHLVQACSAAMFKSSPLPVNFKSEIELKDPYSVAKHSTWQLSKLYREKYNLSISNVVMFNHESIWRPEAFLTRKISRAVSRIALGLADELNLWNSTAIRDWGWAEDYMHALIKASNLRLNDDLILATGIGATVGEFVDFAFSFVGLNSQKFVRYSEESISSEKRDCRIGDPSSAKALLDWRASFDWKYVVKHMLEWDLDNSRNNQSVDRFC